MVDLHVDAETQFWKSPAPPAHQNVPPPRAYRANYRTNYRTRITRKAQWAAKATC